MLRLLGWIVLLAGLFIMILGLGLAAQSFVGIYYDLAADPMADAATTAEPEKAAASEMLRWAIIGFAGAPVAVVGLFLTIIAKRNRMRARRFARG